MESWNDGITSILPCGYVDEKGKVHREVEIHPLTGKEEELVAQNHRQDSASLVTMVLSRCLQRLGSIAPVPEDVTGRLAVEDRQFLLLKLRELTFGDRVQATVTCPWPGCGNKVDINFCTKDITDQEHVDKEPQTETDLEANCPGCGREFTIPFDIPGFFFGELRTTIDLLYREVHFLAYHYHWSEREILEMSREKRHKYIEILLEEIEKMTDERVVPPAGFRYGNVNFPHLSDSLTYEPFARGLHSMKEDNKTEIKGAQDPAGNGHEMNQHRKKIRQKDPQKQKTPHGHEAQDTAQPWPQPKTGTTDCADHTDLKNIKTQKIPLSRGGVPRNEEPGCVKNLRKKARFSHTSGLAQPEAATKPTPPLRGTPPVEGNPEHFIVSSLKVLSACSPLERGSAHKIRWAIRANATIWSVPPLMGPPQAGRGVLKSSQKNKIFTNSSTERSATAANRGRQTGVVNLENLRKTTGFSPDSSSERGKNTDRKTGEKENIEIPGFSEKSITFPSLSAEKEYPAPGHETKTGEPALHKDGREKLQITNYKLQTNPKSQSPNYKQVPGSESQVNSIPQLIEEFQIPNPGIQPNAKPQKTKKSQEMHRKNRQRRGNEPGERGEVSETYQETELVKDKVIETQLPGKPENVKEKSIEIQLSEKIGADKSHKPESAKDEAVKTQSSTRTEDSVSSPGGVVEPKPVKDKITEAQFPDRLEQSMSYEKRTAESKAKVIPKGKVVSRSYPEAAMRIEQLRQQVRRLNQSKTINPEIASTSPSGEEINRETENEEQVQILNPVDQPVTIVKRLPSRSKTRQTIRAFWERSYLGRFHLRTLR